MKRTEATREGTAAAWLMDSVTHAHMHTHARAHAHTPPHTHTDSGNAQAHHCRGLCLIEMQRYVQAAAHLKLGACVSKREHRHTTHTQTSS